MTAENLGIKNGLKEKLIAKFLAPLWMFLKQGVTPEKLAMTLAIGMVLGAFPVIGVTTIICLGAALLFRLNIAALQFVNFLSYPIQVLLIIPFYQLGATLFKDKPFTANYYELKTKISNDFISTILEFWEATWHAIVVWLLVAPFATFLIYFAVFPLLVKIKNKKPLS